MLSIVVVAASLLTLCSCQLEKCPSAITRDQYLQVHGDSCFMFSIYRLRTHTEAKAECATNKGTLALVKSQELQDYLYDQLLHTYKSPLGKAWIGLDDVAVEDKFVWEDGTSLAYQNFAPGEGIANTTQGAHSAHPNEDCVLIDVSAQGKWRDFPCDANPLFLFTAEERHAFVCQYKIN
ncbi:unnamed protein product [Lymnaea stagnalis]|uniref:C-type lectin domain-containing protein n=1 Tax=Lymnaea stagnalis TaxID=6523 RepID=A0AAV2H0T9_LYMST